MKKNIAIIPARSGSKGFPNKNIAKINGLTLIELAIKTAKQSKLIHDIYVSTDSEIYEDIAKKAGAKSVGLRSEKLSGDDVKTVDVVIDLLNIINNKYNYVVLLQPTSPVRIGLDIDNMISEVEKKQVDAAVSVVKIEDPHPQKMKKIDGNGYIQSFIQNATSETPRQKLPEVYALNGAVYVVKMKALIEEFSLIPKKTIPYHMKYCLNIDSEIDHSIIKALVSVGVIEV